jgi:predicted PurR-regulated permease PerM
VTVWTVGIHVLLLMAALTVIQGALDVIAWIAVAVLLALALDPVVRFLARHGIPRTAAVVLVALALVSLLALLVGTLVPMLVEQGRALADEIPGLLQRLQRSGLAAWMEERLDLIGRARGELAERAGEAARPFFALVGGVVRWFAATLTVVVLTMFMLLFGPSLFTSLLGWFAPADRVRIEDVATRVSRAVGGYVTGTLFIATIGGCVTTVTLLLLGVPYFLPLGLVMIILGLIPFLGAALGGILIVGITFLTAGPQKGLIALGVFLAYQQSENHLLQPLIQRHTIKMNPLAIAIVMLVGTAFAGILGAVIALPFAAATYIVLDELASRRRRRWEEPPPRVAPGSAGVPVPPPQPA